MSNLDDILKNAKGIIVEPDNGSWHYATDVVKDKEAIKQLVLELIGEDMPIPRPTDDESRDRFYRVSGQNFTRNELRKKVEEL